MNRILITIFILVISSSCTIPQPFDFQHDRSFMITIQGAIEHPGIVMMDPYPTIEDVLKRVSILPEADLSAINLQTILHHKDILNIPYKKAEPCVSINTGTLSELISLNGVGEKTAQAIIDYRTSVGLFQKIDDLLNVKGIGHKTLAKFKERLCL
jgi:competence protein ComEA